MKTDPTAAYVTTKARRPDFSWTHIDSSKASRLSLSVATEPRKYSYEDHAARIQAECGPDHAFFLDTCFVVKEEVPEVLWNAITERCLIITPGIHYELQQWLAASSPLNRALRDHLVAAIRDGHKKTFVMDILDLKNSHDRAVWHYASLLGLRKRAHELVQPGLEASLGRPPTDEELQREVQKLVQDRGMTLAKKGKADWGKANFFADEGLVVRAFLYALETGNNTTILTRDKDLTEQFYKLQYLLDTHYRSMLLADAYVRQPLDFRVQCEVEHREVEDVPHWPYESATILRMPAGMEHRVLPDQFESVNIEVDRVIGDDGALHCQSALFSADTEMLRLVDVKSKTDGLNTDRLGELNFHRCVSPFHQERWGGCAAVVKDRFVEGTDVKWAAVDVQLTLSRCERVGQSKGVEVERPTDRQLKEVEEAAAISIERMPQRLTPTYSFRTHRCRVDVLAMGLELMPPWTRFYVDGSILPLIKGRLGSTLTSHQSTAIQGQLAPTVEGIGFVSGFGDPKVQLVCDYYTALLAHRKMFGKIRRDACYRQLGRKPTDWEFKTDLFELGGANGWLRALDYLGRSVDDATAFDDEKLVVHALMNAILEGREAVILTARPTLVEQFWTMSRMLESHYRAWAISVDRGAEFPAPSPKGLDERTGFEGGVHMLRLPKETVDEAMPVGALQIDVQCWLLGNHARDRVDVFPVGFPVEPAMHKMLMHKTESDFASALGPEGRNVHFQWTKQRLGQFWIGKDRQIEIGSKNFPGDSRLNLTTAHVPAFDLIMTTNGDKLLPFPWIADLENMWKKERTKRQRRKRRQRR